MYKQDTIAAIATPLGEGGVAIVRISGPDAEQIGAAVFIQNKPSTGKLKSHTLYHGKIRDPGSDAIRDEVLFSVMRKPHSYTGEDVVEIHCHGGVFLVREVLGLILSHGARHADPGEFTKRAFLNGRIDLVQAEGILDLIHAQSREAVSLAVNQLNGGVSEWIEQMRSALLEIMAQVEAAIDFPDEDIELLDRSQLKRKIANFKQQIRMAIGTYESGRLYREGAKVCICGRPNVGKSSLLNRILGEERVIVTPIPGTTRDIIEESINIGGLPVVFWDTAGLRETEDQVERIGVELSKRHIDKADLVLLVLDGSEQLTLDDQRLLGAIDKKMLIVLNKEDLPRQLEIKQLKDSGGANVYPVSAKLGTGTEELKNALREHLLGVNGESPVVITNVRHKSALARCERALDHAELSACENYPAEFLAVDLSDARDALEEVIGRVDNDEILEHIFSDFCIGK